MKLLSIAALSLAATAGPVYAADVQREPLATITVQPRKPVDRVEVKRLTIPPGGKTGFHTHPGPTISYVVSGLLAVKIAGGEEKTFHAGEVIYEPGNTTIEKFDNAGTEPAVFITSYLLSVDDKEIIHMLEPAKPVGSP
jgi:quercetin dioxygenase-like cupin family protein